MEDLVQTAKWLFSDGVHLYFDQADPPPLALHTLLVFHSWLLDSLESETFEDFDVMIAQEHGWPTLAERRASA